MFIFCIYCFNKTELPSQLREQYSIQLKVWQAELVATFFRWLPEDVTIHNEDLDGTKQSFHLFAGSSVFEESLSERK